MNIIRTDVNTWLRSQSHLAAGPSFPFGEFSCVPLAPDEGDAPVGFLLSKDNSVTVVEPDGANSALWQHLLDEMAHWRVHAKTCEELPAECWYG
jgi:hypothetical protein